MSESIEFIKDRAIKTISAANQLAADWTWQEKTIAEIQEMVKAIIGDNEATPPVLGQEEITSQKEQIMLDARTLWDSQLDILHRRTVQAVGMLKNRFRRDPAKSAMLKNPTASSNSRSETLAEALALESAWAQVEPMWAPLPANTLDAFKTLRNQCEETLRKGYSDARTAWRDEAETLGSMGADLEEVLEAWYADATKVFDETTPEGQMIRGTIPTTFTPPSEPPAPPPPPPTPPPGP